MKKKTLTSERLRGYFNNNQFELINYARKLAVELMMSGKPSSLNDVLEELEARGSAGELNK
jgi:hypothetical protein